MSDLILEDFKNLDTERLVKTLEKLVKILAGEKWKISGKEGYQKKESGDPVADASAKVEENEKTVKRLLNSEL